MSYFIFQKNMDGVVNSLYRIADNENDLNNLNINKSDYKIVQDSQGIYNNVRYNKIRVTKYTGNNVSFENLNFNYKAAIELNNYVQNVLQTIKFFLNNNPNHVDYVKWKNYYDQLLNFDYKSITYPFTISIEEHFQNISQPSLNPLQVP